MTIATIIHLPGEDIHIDGFLLAPQRDGRSVIEYDGEEHTIVVETDVITTRQSAGIQHDITRHYRRI